MTGSPTTKREYLIEFRQIGGTIKVSALDPVSGTEVSIVGDAKASEAELKRIAVNKLEYVMQRSG